MIMDKQSWIGSIIELGESLHCYSLFDSLSFTEIYNLDLTSKPELFAMDTVSEPHKLGSYKFYKGLRTTVFIFYTHPLHVRQKFINNVGSEIYELWFNKSIRLMIQMSTVYTDSSHSKVQ